MPRAATSEANRILGFFQNGSYEAAALLFGIISDVMRARKSEEVSDRPARPAAKRQFVRRARKQTEAAAPVAAAPPANEATSIAEQPTARKRRARKPAEQPELRDEAVPGTAPGEYGG